MIERVLLFGATGDLAGRFLLPAVAELWAEGLLPQSFEVIGAAPHELNDAAFLRVVIETLERHASNIPVATRQSLLSRLRYRQVDLASDDLPVLIQDLLSIFSDGPAGQAMPVAVYLALPPGLFVRTIRALGGNLPRGSRIVVEKPFGEDLQSAIALNQLLADVVGTAGESAVFRVDHVLGMASVYNLLGMRLSNRVFEALWNSTHIEQVEILWEETLALEGRAGYYDGVGALKDVMQNHMLQILALVAMEPPVSMTERDFRDRKVDVLRTVRPPEPAQMSEQTRRARYTAGRLAATGGAAGGEVPDYVSEEGVNPTRDTETFAEVELQLESPRWMGTRFVMRAGKALHRRWKGVIVRFRPVPHMPFGADLKVPDRNELLIGLDGPESLSLHLTGSAPGPPAALVPLALTAPLPSAELRPYSRVLLSVLTDDCGLSVRGDETEQAWRIMTPVLSAWAENRVPLEEYPAGSSGPPQRRAPPKQTEGSP